MVNKKELYEIIELKIMDTSSEEQAKALKRLEPKKKRAIERATKLCDKFTRDWNKLKTELKDDKDISSLSFHSCSDTLSASVSMKVPLPYTGKHYTHASNYLIGTLHNLAKSDNKRIARIAKAGLDLILDQKDRAELSTFLDL